MKTIAAVLEEVGKPLIIEELEIPSLKDGQVLVEILYSGVCHTQILEARGYKGADPYVPHCMGHEGVGRVLEVTPGITRVKSGDEVLLSWMKASGCDVPGTIYTGRGGRKVNSGGITTFSQHSVISENRLTKIPQGLKLTDCTMIGCAVATGMGAVFNTAKVSKGDTVVVFGAGGIGLFAISAAKIAGASKVIAVDINPLKLETASLMGATHLIDGADPKLMENLKSIAPEGINVAIEATGKTQIMQSALSSVRSQGGIAVVIGNAKHGDLLTIDPKEFNMGKQLRGTWGGDNVPDRDFPIYCQCLVEKKFSLDPIKSKEYRLEDINEALNDLESGKVIRPVIKTQ